MTPAGAALPSLAELLECPRCRASAWTTEASGRDGRLTCRSCAATFAWTDGVLALGNAGEDRRVALERAAVRETERRPELGGINDAFEDLSRAEGELRAAILALPAGNDSRYFREPGYFVNVRASAAAFDFLVRHLRPERGQRLLDLGADLTWSTCWMARLGLDCVAVDINHHLSVARLYEEHFGVSYGLVRAGMADAPFRADTFDIVLALNALHHGGHLDAVAANVARMLRPGGRLAFVEPYCASEEAKAAFGRAQIEAGISEQTYLLQEWHAAFARVGLHVQVLRVGDSFAAIYGKPREAGGQAPGDLFARFYEARLSVVDATPRRIQPGTTFTVPIVLENRGNAVWCSTSQFPVYASYHLSRRGASGDDLVAFDNPRTPLAGDLGPGQQVTLALQITAPLAAGIYVAEIDVVHEYVSWFASRGLTGRSVSFHVVED